MKDSVSITYAGFWVRFLAFILDLSILVFPAVVAIFLSRYQEEVHAAAVATPSAILFYMMLLSLIYRTACNESKMQTTVGKWVFQLKIVNEKGDKASAEQIIGRYFASYLSLLIFGVGYLMIAWSKNKRGLHDIMAGTAVIKAPRQKGSWL